MSAFDDCEIEVAPRQDAAQDVAVHARPMRPKRKAGLPVAAQKMEKWRLEEPALILAWQKSASDEALSMLLKRYEFMIRKQVARIVAGRAVSSAHQSDLEQEANMAFVLAVTKYDPEVGSPLSVIATTYVRNALLRYGLDFRNSYRIGTSTGERKAYYAALAKRSKRIHSGLSDLLDNQDIEDIRKATGASKKSTQRAVDAIYARMTSIEEAEEVEAERNEQRACDHSMSIAKAMNHLKPFIEKLDDRQQAIFAQLSQTGEVENSELATQFGLTVERIGQIRRDLMSDLARHLKSKGIVASDLF